MDDTGTRHPSPAAALGHLARLRDDAGVSAADLAETLGVTSMTLARTEQAADPDWSTVTRYASALAALTRRPIRLDVGVTVADPPDTPPAASGDRVARIRARNDRDLEARMLREGFVSMGGAEVGDLSRWPGRDVLAGLLAEALLDREPQAIQLFCTYWDRFIRWLRVGDLVVLPSATTKTFAVGEVTGPYEYVADESDHARHRRPVRWLATRVPRADLDDDLRRIVNAPGTIAAIGAPGAAERIRRHAR